MMILYSVLLLLLSLILAGGSRVSADNDKIHCVADDGNYECLKTTTCSFDNQAVRMFPYIYEACVCREKILAVPKA